MLPKEFRLSKEKDFERVFKLGKGGTFGFLTLRYLRNNLNLSRLGFIVSNKVSNKATVRHKIKRRLRESVRSMFGKIKPGYDCVIIASPKIKEKNFQEIDKTMEKLLEKAKMI